MAFDASKDSESTAKACVRGWGGNKGRRRRTKQSMRASQRPASKGSAQLEPSRSLARRSHGPVRARPHLLHEFGHDARQGARLRKVLRGGVLRFAELRVDLDDHVELRHGLDGEVAREFRKLLEVVERELDDVLGLRPDDLLGVRLERIRKVGRNLDLLRAVDGFDVHGVGARRFKCDGRESGGASGLRANTTNAHAPGSADC